MKKIRLSYSLLNLWSQGKTDEVVSSYFHLRTAPSVAQQTGINHHIELKKYIDTHKKFPDHLPQFKLENPVTEHTIITPYNEVFDLKGIIDVYDVRTLYEFKTGITDSAEYSNTMQVPFYFLLCKLTNTSVDRAIITHYNQHTNEKDWTLVWNGPEVVQKAQNLIDSVGPEIWSFFDKEGYL